MPQRALEPSTSEPQDAQRDGDVAGEAFDFSRPWFDLKTAAAYVGCRTVRAFYDWKKRHAIVGSGRRVMRADLDRAMKAPRRPRRMAEASLRNLRNARRA